MSGMYAMWNWRPKFQAACQLVAIPPQLDISNGGCGVITKIGFERCRACLDHLDFEWYQLVFITEFPKRMGPTEKNLVWLGSWAMFPSLKTQKFEWWMMETKNRISVFSVSEIWVMVAKSELCDWVMWPNNNFGVFEIKWGLGYELWVLNLSYELWVLSYEIWVMAKPNKPIVFRCWRQ